MQKCKHGAVLVSKMVRFSSVARSVLVCPSGCSQGGNTSGWSATQAKAEAPVLSHEPEDGFNNIPGWKDPSD